jgi:SEC-C motif domain protein
MKCHCGAEQDFANCCEPYILGKQVAPTPEALMRSRYSAHVVKNSQYLHDTMYGDVIEEFDIAESQDWLQDVRWISLNVFRVVERTHELGYVSFDAVYEKDGKIVHLCEKSEFHKIEGRWYYVDGKPLNPAGRSKSELTK